MPFAHRMGLFTLELALLALLSPMGADARTWHVAADHSGDAPTIQAAILGSLSGDTVLVTPGTYVENINFLGKTLSVLSASGPEVTTIDGSNVAESVVLFVTGETKYSLLEGFTVTGGRGHFISSYFSSGSHGGGICIDNSSPQIRNCIVRGNQAKFGGGVHIGGENALDPSLVAPRLDGNTITDNTALSGGGLSLFFGDAVITNNRFVNNDATEKGGGIMQWSRGGSPIMSHNQFRGNDAITGGGLFAYGHSVTVTFNLFAQNIATGDANEGAGGGAAFYNTYETLIANNTFVQNAGGSPTNQCLGGGFILRAVWYVEVTRNIIALNSGCGVACTIPHSFPIAYLDNLLWGNTNEEFVGCGDLNETWVIADPEFCGAVSGDYSLSSTSPAFGPGGPMGAFPVPGCGPVPVRESTWGSMKSRTWRNK